MTKDEAGEIAESFGAGLRPREMEWASQSKRATSIEGMTSHRKLAYAVAACRWVFRDSPRHVLLCVTEYGIWGEHRPLEASLRAQVADSGEVENKPGLIVGPNDLDFLISYVFVAMTFGWGLVMMDSTGGRWFECDHDGRAWVGANDAEAVEEAGSWLDWE